MRVPVGPEQGCSTLCYFKSLRELGAYQPTEGPQRGRKTLESPAPCMIQQEECLSEGWVGLDSLKGFLVPSVTLEPGSVPRHRQGHRTAWMPGVLPTVPGV